MTSPSFGLLGEHLSHSRSQEIHAQLGNYTYQLFPTAPEELDRFMKSGCFQGLNVTIPYKEKVLPYCNRLTETAKRIGSVNTIMRGSDGILTGYNTDYYGFLYLLSSLSFSVKGKKVLVLGSGGASKAVCCALRDSYCRELVIVSRSGSDNYENLSRHADTDLIVNTTPVGMFPDNHSCPLSLDVFPSLTAVIDIICNPLLTTLLSAAKARGLVYSNGLPMLVAQAAKASELFTGIPVSKKNIAKIYNSILSSERNIVLIGMPGCGKTTLATMLSILLNRDLIDTDDIITKQFGQTPAEIILSEGEPVFRQKETEVLKEAGAQTGIILATGGGVVTRPENYRFLSQNGLLVFIDRDPSLLPSEGRPLSADFEQIKKLYTTRLPLYHSFADLELKAAKTIQESFDELCKLLQLT